MIVNRQAISSIPAAIALTLSSIAGAQSPTVIELKPGIVTESGRAPEPQMRTEPMTFTLIDRSALPDVLSRNYTHVILAEGSIDARSPERFLAFTRANGLLRDGPLGLLLPAFDARVLVRLRSGGGDVAQSFMIGQQIRSMGMDTEVDQGCYSACVFVFAAGKGRYYRFGQLGVHRLSRETRDISLTDTYAAASAIAAYVNKMGVGFEFLSFMGQSPPEGITVLPPKQAEAIGLANQGLVAGAPFWSGSKNALILQNESPLGNLELVTSCRKGSVRTDINLFMQDHADLIAQDGDRRSYFLSVYDPLDSNFPILPTRPGERADIRAVNLGRFARKTIVEGDVRGAAYQFRISERGLSTLVISPFNLFIFSAESDLSKVRLIYRGRVPVASPWANSWEFSECSS